MKTREDILFENPLVSFLQSQGVKLIGSGKQLVTNSCASTEHGSKHLCVSIDTERQLFHCNDCNIGGTIIDWMMIQNNQSAGEVMAVLSGETFQSRQPDAKPSGQTSIKAIYEYLNESREMVYQVVRMEPKTFRQRRPDGSGGWIWNMEGITRILFNLPDVIAAKTVIVVEGEKDAMTAGRFGMVGTCNVGGAGKWLDAYSQVLAGKDIIIIPDNDPPGRKHGESILASVSDCAGSVKVVIIPSPYKDLTDYIESFPSIEIAEREFRALIDKSAHIVKPLPIYSIAEMEEQYRALVQQPAQISFSLCNFLPALGELIAPMVPGEMLLFLADTGIGKTMALQNMVRSASPLPSLLFELELPLPLVFERFVQMEIGCLRSDVQNEYREQNVPLHTAYAGLRHITVCPESGLSVEQIEKYIVKSELKLGCKPALVAVDYVGLIRHSASKNRYEAISNAAEQLKVIAKRTNVIMLVASQIGRPDKKKEDISVGLHDGRDSGALENSAGIVIGAWRPERTRMMMKILKNTSGTSGETVEAYVNGATMRITAPNNQHQT